LPAVPDADQAALDSPANPTESAARVADRRRFPNFATWLVAAAACVLLFGLPRVLVTCSGGDAGAHHVEFVHAFGTCCDHDHGPAAAPLGTPTRPTTPVVDEPGCEHGSFAFELLPPERSHRGPDVPPPQWLGQFAAPFVRSAAAPHPRTPPATGPPRPDPRHALRQTTLLLL
jgi:hypothetical protein